ncbi:hypothetical protein CVT26_009241, partial [Gymnopilus dilepis]
RGPAAGDSLVALQRLRESKVVELRGESSKRRAIGQQAPGSETAKEFFVKGSGNALEKGTGCRSTAHITKSALRRLDVAENQKKIDKEYGVVLTNDTCCDTPQLATSASSSFLVRRHDIDKPHPAPALKGYQSKMIATRPLRATPFSYSLHHHRPPPKSSQALLRLQYNWRTSQPCLGEQDNERAVEIYGLSGGFMGNGGRVSEIGGV